MKTLIVSIKTPEEFFDEAKMAFKAVIERKAKGTHYEISFDNKKSFDRFIKNIGILSIIRSKKPNSVYELAKLADMDVSNLNKIILFFEEQGVITIRRKKVAGRVVSTPIVNYDKIEFKLAA